MTEEPEEDGSRRGPLIALLVVVVLIVGGIFLTHVLAGVSKIQDCAMSGRSNCAPAGG
jgi:hypothetical protein